MAYLLASSLSFCLSNLMNLANSKQLKAVSPEKSKTLPSIEIIKLVMFGLSSFKISSLSSMSSYLTLASSI